MFPDYFIVDGPKVPQELAILQEVQQDRPQGRG